MGEIIHLFEKVQCNSAQTLLDACKIALDEDDYRDLLCAIMDTDYYYNLMEPDISVLVERYFELV